MSEAWKQLDLEGEGLQSANLRLSRLLKSRKKAYALLAAFPLGLHRVYLEDRRGAWLYRAGSLLGLALAWLNPWAGLAALVLLLGLVAYDALRTEERVARLNKAARMRVYMKQGAGAPQGYRGRYRDDAPDLEGYIAQKEAERGGHQPFKPEAAPTPRKRLPSFAEQEALLRELAQTRRGPGRTREKPLEKRSEQSSEQTPEQLPSADPEAKP